MKHIIDCDAPPFCPEGLHVDVHRKGGQLEWSPTKINQYVITEQRSVAGRPILYGELMERIADKPVLNANVLDYLLANQHLIPKKWKGKSTFFWGTTYADSEGHPFVRILSNSGHRWHWYKDWLNYDFLGFLPASLVNRAR